MEGGSSAVEEQTKLDVHGDDFSSGGICLVVDGMDGSGLREETWVFW